MLLLGANLLVLGMASLTVVGNLYLLFPEPDRVEVERATSPEGAYDAVPLFGGFGSRVGQQRELRVVRN